MNNLHGSSRVKGSNTSKTERFRGAISQRKVSDEVADANLNWQTEIPLP